MRRRKPPYLILLVVLFLVILIIEIYLPLLAENRVRDIIVSQIEQADRLTVEVASFPALEVLAGRIDHLEVDAEGVVVDGLYLNKLLARYREVSYSKDDFQGINTILDIIITEKALNDYIHKRYPDLQNFRISLQPDLVILKGTLKIFEARIGLQLSGRMTIDEDQVVAFRPENLQVEEFNIPSSLLQNYLNDLGFIFDLKSLNIPLKVDEIVISQGEVRVYGNQE